jgi:import inner membrane translocase subunit TIM13
MGDPDLNARKEAVMASVRNELALANAQELMNVRCFACFFPLVFQSKKKTRSHDCGVPPSSLSIIQKTNDKCYAKCVTKPSTSLSGSEEVRRFPLCLFTLMP